MKKKYLVASVALIGGLMISQPAMARTSIGLGVGFAPDYEGSEDYDAVPMLFYQYSYGNGSYVQLRGTTLKWNLFDDQYQFGPLVKYRFERDDVDDDQVDRLRDVDEAIEAGFFFNAQFGQFGVGVDFAADVSDEHEGYLVTLGGDYRAEIAPDFSMTFGVSTTYASEDFMETYFQIDSSNRGTSSLPNYSADDGEFKDIGFSIVSNYQFNDSWSLVTNFAYTALLGDAEDSPIVSDRGDENQFFLGAMGVYTF